jgi:hypothetical protein
VSQCFSLCVADIISIKSCISRLHLPKSLAHSWRQAPKNVLSSYFGHSTFSRPRLTVIFAIERKISIDLMVRTRSFRIYRRGFHAERCMENERKYIQGLLNSYSLGSLFLNTRFKFLATHNPCLTAFTHRAGSALLMSPAAQMSSVPAILR